MNALTDMYDRLALALTGDPQLLLASTIAVFDPFWDAFEADEIDYETDPLHIALQVTRGAFPDIYAEAVERLRAGATYQDMDHLLCKAITAQGIPLDDLDLIGWGVPLFAVGIDLEDPEFYAVHTAVLPALVPFGIDTPESVSEATYSIEVPEWVYQAGRAIAADLERQTDPVLKQLGWLYAWLFSCSGNSLIDLTDEVLSELQPLSWSPDDITFACEMIEEANGILHDARQALDTLNTSTGLKAALECNITLLNRELEQKGRLDERPPRLEWPCTDGGTERTTVPDAEFLQLRRDAA